MGAEAGGPRQFRLNGSCPVSPGGRRYLVPVSLFTRLLRYKRPLPTTTRGKEYIYVIHFVSITGLLAVSSDQFPETYTEEEIGTCRLLDTAVAAVETISMLLPSCGQTGHRILG